MDNSLSQLYILKNELQAERVQLRMGLARLRYEQTGWFLRLRAFDLRMEQQIMGEVYKALAAEIESQRDELESELVEIQLLLGHVNAQIAELKSLAAEADTRR